MKTMTDYNLTWHTMDITKELREERMQQKACTIWMSGLSGGRKIHHCQCTGKAFVCDGEKDDAFRWG